MFRPVYKITTGAFADNNTVKEVILPSTVIEIGDSVFENCTSLEKINFPEGLHYIGRDAFNNCIKLEEMEMSYDDTNWEGLIHARAFMNCTSLKKADFHDCNVEIGLEAFANCSNLKEVCGYKEADINYDSFANTEMMKEWSKLEYFVKNLK